MNIIPAVMRVVASVVSRSTLKLNRPARATTRIEPSAPIEAASVGAATPPMIEPSTASTRLIGGRAMRSVALTRAVRYIGNGDQRVVGDNAIDAGRQQIEEAGTETKIAPKDSG